MALIALKIGQLVGYCLLSLKLLMMIAVVIATQTPRRKTPMCSIPYRSAANAIADAPDGG